MKPRFTLDGSDALEQTLEALCADALAGARSVIPAACFDGMLLGGGYGRGEGGVLRTADGDEPYNDLEYYVCCRGNRWLNERRFQSGLSALARNLGDRARLDVEFKLISFAHLRESPTTMFYHDLVMGHRWLHGDDSLLEGCEHHRLAQQIPAFEATRLLMNRCSGLLFAKERLLRPSLTPEDADFIGRNLAKAQLGFGDAVLALLGQYHYSCRKRHHRLEKLDVELPWMPDVQQHHTSGLEFKLHPRRTIAIDAAIRDRHSDLMELGRQVWLWVENQRLQTNFASTTQYALSDLDKCPETAPWRNRLINVRTFGASAAWRRRAGRYPRERILHALALLLWEPRVLYGPEFLKRLQEELFTRATARQELVSHYHDIWHQFS